MKKLTVFLFLVLLVIASVPLLASPISTAGEDITTNDYETSIFIRDTALSNVHFEQALTVDNLTTALTETVAMRTHMIRTHETVTSTSYTSADAPNTTLTDLEHTNDKDMVNALTDRRPPLARARDVH